MKPLCKIKKRMKILIFFLCSYCSIECGVHETEINYSITGFKILTNNISDMSQNYQFDLPNKMWLTEISLNQLAIKGSIVSVSVCDTSQAVSAMPPNTLTTPAPDSSSSSSSTTQAPDSSSSTTPAPDSSTTPAPDSSSSTTPAPDSSSSTTPAPDSSSSTTPAPDSSSSTTPAPDSSPIAPARLSNITNSINGESSGCTKIVPTAVWADGDYPRIRFSDAENSVGWPIETQFRSILANITFLDIATARYLDITGGIQMNICVTSKNDKNLSSLSDLQIGQVDFNKIGYKMSVLQVCEFKTNVLVAPLISWASNLPLGVKPLIEIFHKQIKIGMLPASNVEKTGLLSGRIKGILNIPNGSFIVSYFLKNDIPPGEAQELAGTHFHITTSPSLEGPVLCNIICQVQFHYQYGDDLTNLLNGCKNSNDEFQLTETEIIIDDNKTENVTDNETDSETNDEPKNDENKINNFDISILADMSNTVSSVLDFLFSLHEAVSGEEECSIAESSIMQNLNTDFLSTVVQKFKDSSKTERTSRNLSVDQIGDLIENIDSNWVDDDGETWRLQKNGETSRLQENGETWRLQNKNISSDKIFGQIEEGSQNNIAADRLERTRNGTSVIRNVVTDAVSRVKDILPGDETPGGPKVIENLKDTLNNTIISSTMEKILGDCSSECTILCSDIMNIMFDCFDNRNSTNLQSYQRLYNTLKEGLNTTCANGFSKSYKNTLISKISSDKIHETDHVSDHEIQSDIVGKAIINYKNIRMIFVVVFFLINF
eukprot:GHVL01043680.1.p1 GENE.GHVL01043680.1~~GHVL01043680.1.p1  ORF type:complete len:772 (-),score=158.77 GHVL01043680.1:1690-4005(-)